MEFEEFPKIARLSRDIVITEKIDGTNAQVLITDKELYSEAMKAQGKTPYWSVECQKNGTIIYNDLLIRVGSRTRYLNHQEDNFGFWKWVSENASEISKLGPGRHYGEWWGHGIQRNYGLTERRFSLFNVGRWNKDNVPKCCSVVPTLYMGVFSTVHVDHIMDSLADVGSRAAPGFKDPEGIIIYHTASRQLYKKTLENDESPKSKLAEIKK